MPLRKPTRKEHEKFLIQEFVQALGYGIAKPRWTERPDAIITLIREGESKRVGVEHTDYHCDAPPGTPSEANVEEFWKAVQDSVVRRVCRDPRLRRTLVTVGFADLTQLLSQSRNEKILVARALAGDLVSLVRQTECLNDHVIVRRPRGQRIGIWEYVESVRAFEPGDGPENLRLTWRCSNTTTGNVELRLDYITGSVRAKTKKARKYDWRDACERWLLISAPGRPVQRSAGPPTQDVDWSDERLQAACAESGFDKIYFFEGVWRWYKQVWPEAQVVVFRDD